MMRLTQHQTLSPGRSRGFLPTGAGGPDLPVWTIEGDQPGPTLVLSAGVHGCEYVGILALRALFGQIQPKDLHGRLLLLPLVNAGGFYAGAKRVVPLDGKNINRVFPAPDGGTAAERIAYAIQTQVYPEADFLLDLHGGDANEAMTPLVFFPVDAAPDVCSRSLQAARHLETRYRVPSTAKNGLYSCAAQQGIPALLMEVGGQGRWSSEEVAMELRSIQNLMAFLGMGGDCVPDGEQVEIAQASYDEARRDGLWVPLVCPGQPVAAGQPLGTLTDLEGNLLQTVHARWDGVVLYHTVSLGVAAGDALVACGRPASPEA